MTVFDPGISALAPSLNSDMRPDRTRSRGRPDAWSLIAAAYALCLLCWLASGWEVSSRPGQAVLNLAFQPLNAAAAIGFWFASRRVDGSARLRRALKLLAAGNAAVFVGNMIWFVQMSVLGIDPTYSWANVPYLLSYALGFAGVLSLPVVRRRPFEWWKFLLDATLSSLGGVAVVWFLVIRPLAAADVSPLQHAILLAFPIGALTFFVAILTRVLHCPIEGSLTGLRIFALGQGISLMGDLLYQLVYRTPSAYGVWSSYALYAVSYVLLVRSAEVYARPARTVARPARRDEDLHLWTPIPWITAAAVYGLLLWDAIRSWTPSLSVLVVVAIVLTILLLVREAATVRQNVRLVRARAIRDSELRFESLVRHSADPLLVLDADLVVRFASPATTRVLGSPAGELVSAPVVQRLHPDDAARAEGELHEAVRQPGVPRALNWRVRHANGTWRHLDIAATSLLGDESIGGIVLAARDITERDALEERLRQAQKMEAIGQLAGGIAHDFNNLLTTILGTADLALEQLDGPTPLRGEIEEIQKAGRRAAALTGQLLAFSRKQVIEARVLDVGGLVASTHRMLQRLIGEQINFVVRIEPGIGCIYADAAQIEQTLMNLIVNARDAIKGAGSITLEAVNLGLGPGSADPELAGLVPGPYVGLRVSDTGTGMDAATRARIFEPFFTTKGLGRGTGLGLATVYGIVRGHGGALSVESAIGEGSRFTVYLPRVERAAPASAPEPADDAPVPGGGETILLVEDEVAVLRTTSRALRTRGYTVLEARDGDAALGVLHNHLGPIDLVVTDVILPGRSGPQVVTELRRLRPGIRVLYVSGYTGQELGPHGVLAPGIALLQKPYSLGDLADRVRQALSAAAPGAA